MQIDVHRIRWNGPRWHEVVAVRSIVFMEELGIASAIEFDGKDAGCVHLLATADGAPAGAVRIFDNEIGRGCVLKRLRRQGVIDCLMEAAEAIVRARGYETAISTAELDVFEKVWEPRGWTLTDAPRAKQLGNRWYLGIEKRLVATADALLAYEAERSSRGGTEDARDEQGA